jgi:hypothetical protein
MKRKPRRKKGVGTSISADTMRFSSRGLPRSVMNSSNRDGGTS